MPDSRQIAPESGVPRGPRDLLPTAESAAGIRRKYDLAIRQRSIFSARTTQARYLDTLRNLLDAWEAGRIRQDEAEEILRQKLSQLGYDPEAGGFPGDVGIPPADKGTLRDLASHARLDFVLRHQQAFARSLARKAEAASDPVAAYLFPAWRLVRAGKPNVPRNWIPRWQSAWAACGGEGAHPYEFVALKSSPIWAALGEVGDDSTGSDVPPFAYNSTMDWEDVEREECIRLGLIREDEEPAAPEFGDEEAFAGIDKALADLPDEDAAQLERELEAMARGEGIANEAAFARDLARIANTAQVPAGYANGGQFTGKTNPPAGRNKAARRRATPGEVAAFLANPPDRIPEEMADALLETGFEDTDGEGNTVKYGHLLRGHLDRDSHSPKDRIARKKRLGVAVKVIRQTKPVASGNPGKPAERVYFGWWKGKAYVAVADEHGELGAMEMVSYRRDGKNDA
ncbi:MAG: hypothetical protein IJS32_00350 [Kiritimatiellae bacterium]|nr:hypothetical protein [Kiritimatiellia bacterium]